MLHHTDRTIIGVMGASECGDEAHALAYEVGRLIAERGAVLLNGGREGVMESSAKGAYEAGGTTIGILKGSDRAKSPANPYIEIALRTGFGDARNWVNVCAADALIAIAGGWGTLSEIALAKKANKPIVLLDSWNLAHTHIPDPPPTAETAEQAVEMAFEAIPARPA